MEQQIMEKESEKKIKMLEDEAILHHEKTLADAQHYQTLRVAEANKAIFSPEYLRNEMIKAVGNNTKVYFGPSIQSMWMDFLDLALNKQISSTTTPVVEPTKSTHEPKEKASR
jgi:hypothetical protein